MYLIRVFPHLSGNCKNTEHTTMKIRLIIIFAAILTIAACSAKEQPEKQEMSSPVSGRLTIGIDESLRPAINAEIDMFSYYYKDAHITPLYLPEKQVVEKLLNNEIQTGIICRDLSKDEAESIKGAYQHVPESFRLAEDAIVPVVNMTNPVNDISYDDLKKILSGQITTWNQINLLSADKSPIIVIMTSSSSVSRYFSTLNGRLSSIKSYALESTSDVIDYVKKNPHSLGILGGSWFYQRGNKYPDIKVLSYKDAGSSGATSMDGLVREVYAITHEPYKGLGAGFISFIASQKGQMIISAAGMTPFQPISREVQIFHSFQH
jgi:phosphate transport system substrate-binding protein